MSGALWPVSNYRGIGNSISGSAARSPVSPVAEKNQIAGKGPRRHGRYAQAGTSGSQMVNVAP